MQSANYNEKIIINKTSTTIKSQRKDKINEPTTTTTTSNTASEILENLPYNS